MFLVMLKKNYVEEFDHEYHEYEVKQTTCKFSQLYLYLQYVKLMLIVHLAFTSLHVHCTFF